MRKSTGNISPKNKEREEVLLTLEQMFSQQPVEKTILEQHAHTGGHWGLQLCGDRRVDEGENAMRKKPQTAALKD